MTIISKNLKAYFLLDFYQKLLKDNITEFSPPKLLSENTNVNVIIYINENYYHFGIYRDGRNGQNLNKQKKPGNIMR